MPLRAKNKTSDISNENYHVYGLPHLSWWRLQMQKPNFHLTHDSYLSFQLQNKKIQVAIPKTPIQNSATSPTATTLGQQPVASPRL